MYIEDYEKALKYSAQLQMPFLEKAYRHIEEGNPEQHEAVNNILDHLESINHPMYQHIEKGISEGEEPEIHVQRTINADKLQDPVGKVGYYPSVMRNSNKLRHTISFVLPPKSQDSSVEYPVEEASDNNHRLLSFSYTAPRQFSQPSELNKLSQFNVNYHPTKGGYLTPNE
jgi:hypothetical protein